MDHSNITFFPKYVITDDSAPPKQVTCQFSVLKLTVFTFSLIAIAIVSLYFAGVIDETMAVEAVAEEDFLLFDSDGAADASCNNYTIVVDACTDVSVQQIAENSCESYVENSGKLCTGHDVSNTLCVVNNNCDLVDMSEILALHHGSALDALCVSYKHVVDKCSDVSAQKIADDGCMSYVERTGGICIGHDEHETSCVVNNDCDQVDILDVVESSSLKLDKAIDAACESYSILVDACIDVSVEDIAVYGCMSYADNNGGICVSYDDSEKLCVVNEDCTLVDTSGLISI